MPKTKKLTQNDHRQKIDVGSGMSQVSPVSYWHRQGHFKSDAEAKGAFKLAYQQGLDGMGVSTAAWMGLSPEEYDDWMRNDTLPKVNSRVKEHQGSLTFVSWLEQFQEENSVYGDLARDLTSDFPILGNSLEPGLSHLLHKGASYQAKLALKEAWGDFCAEAEILDATPQSVYLDYELIECNEEDL